MTITTSPTTPATTTSPATATSARSVTWARVGGIAALVLAATFITGIVMFATVLRPYAAGDQTPAEAVAQLVDHRAALHGWYIVTHILFGVALVPLTLSLHHRLRDQAPGLSQTAAGFGLIWAALVLGAGMIANVGITAITGLAANDPSQAEGLWSALDTIQDGLGGGNEIAGGMWVLLVSWAILRTGVRARALAWLGLLAGTAGIITVVPGLSDLGLVFGLGLIAWFTWIGITELRTAR